MIIWGDKLYFCDTNVIIISKAQLDRSILGFSAISLPTLAYNNDHSFRDIVIEPLSNKVTYSQAASQTYRLQSYLRMNYFVCACDVLECQSQNRT